MTGLYRPHTLLTNPPSPADVTLELLLASQSHLGHHTSLWNPANSRYIFGVRDGIHIISLDVTAAYLRRAAKVVSSVTGKGGLVLFVGTRENQDRCVVKAAQLAGGCHLFERWIPGSITNGPQILGRCRQKVVDEFDNEVPGFDSQLVDRPSIKPDLVVCLNPMENYVLLHECALNNIPTIGVIDTNANPTWVTYPIPANDDSLRCTHVIGGVLGRAGEEGRNARIEAARRREITFTPAEALRPPKRGFNAASGPVLNPITAAQKAREEAAAEAKAIGEALISGRLTVDWGRQRLPGTSQVSVAQSLAGDAGAEATDDALDARNADFSRPVMDAVDMAPSMTTDPTVSETSVNERLAMTVSDEVPGVGVETSDTTASSAPQSEQLQPAEALASTIWAKSADAVFDAVNLRAAEIRPAETQEASSEATVKETPSNQDFNAMSGALSGSLQAAEKASEAGTTPAPAPQDFDAMSQAMDSSIKSAEGGDVPIAEAPLDANAAQIMPASVEEKALHAKDEKSFLESLSDEEKESMSLRTEPVVGGQSDAAVPSPESDQSREFDAEYSQTELKDGMNEDEALNMKEMAADDAEDLGLNRRRKH